MGIFSNLIKDYINEKSRAAFMEDDIVIFFNKDTILKSLLNTWFWSSTAKNYKSIKDVERKMKKKGITAYYISNDNNNFNEKFAFNDRNNKPELNKLYFKLKDYNDDKVRYYTYNNFIRICEDYKYDFIVFLFMNFGLRYMSWSYNLEDNNSNRKIIRGNLGIKGNNIEGSINRNKENNNLSDMLGSKSFENIGSIDYFNTCNGRAFWYTYCSHNLNETVENILNLNERYSYEYYKNNTDIQTLLEERIGGATDVSYTYKNDTMSKSAISKMATISNNYGSIGFKMVNELIEKHSYNKKYNIKFFIRTELEKTTLENIIWDKNLQKDYIDMNIVNRRYKNLCGNDIDNLIKENEKLKDTIELKKRTLNVCSSNPFNSFINLNNTI